MAFDYNVAVKVILVVLAVIILIALILQYQKKNPKKKSEDGMQRVKEDFTYPEKKKDQKTPDRMRNSMNKKPMGKKEYFEDSSPEETGKSIFEKQKDMLRNFPTINQPVKAIDQKEENEDDYMVQPTEDMNNDDFKAIDFDVSNKSSSDCYPRDRLTTDDLLPKDAANSKWAEVNPAGQGDVKDQNYLQAGVHFGIDTVGQSLRNANKQLRSDPPIPKIEGLSPWNNTTIDYDSNRRHFEIGSI